MVHATMFGIAISLSGSFPVLLAADSAPRLCGPLCKGIGRSIPDLRDASYCLRPKMGLPKQADQLAAFISLLHTKDASGKVDHPQIAASNRLVRHISSKKLLRKAPDSSSPPQFRLNRGFTFAKIRKQSIHMIPPSKVVPLVGHGCCRERHHLVTRGNIGSLSSRGVKSRVARESTVGADTWVRPYSPQLRSAITNDRQSRIPRGTVPSMRLLFCGAQDSQ